MKTSTSWWEPPRRSNSKCAWGLIRLVDIHLALQWFFTSLLHFCTFSPVPSPNQGSLKDHQIIPNEYWKLPTHIHETHSPFYFIYGEDAGRSESIQHDETIVEGAQEIRSIGWRCRRWFARVEGHCLWRWWNAMVSWIVIPEVLNRVYRAWFILLLMLSSRTVQTPSSWMGRTWSEDNKYATIFLGWL